jgi:hypothetical protein
MVTWPVRCSRKRPTILPIRNCVIAWLSSFPPYKRLGSTSYNTTTSPSISLPIYPPLVNIQFDITQSALLTASFNKLQLNKRQIKLRAVDYNVYMVSPTDRIVRAWVRIPFEARPYSYVSPVFMLFCADTVHKSGGERVLYPRRPTHSLKYL